MDLQTPLEDCIEFFKPRNVRVVYEIHRNFTLENQLEREGFSVLSHDVGEDIGDTPLGADAAIAPLVLDFVSRRQMAITIDNLTNHLRPRGLLFVLFDSYRGPDEAGTAGSLTNFKDGELKRSFPEFDLLQIRSYSGGLRGFFLRKR